MNSKNSTVPEFEHVLKTLTQEFQNAFGPKLVGILLFGSSVQKIKAISDVDLYIVYDAAKMNRNEIEKIWQPIEEKIQLDLKALSLKGYNYVVSPIIKCKESAEKFQHFYLDLPEVHRIIFERDSFFTNLIKKIENYRKSSGMIKVQVGNLWYWNLAPDADSKQIKKIGW